MISIGYKSRWPEINQLGLRVGFHVVSFLSLKQLLDWYLSERRYCSMSYPFNRPESEKIEEIYWISIPIHIFKKSTDERLKNKLKNIFPEPTKDEIEKSYLRLMQDVDQEDKPCVTEMMRNFDYYEKMKLYGLNSNFKKVKKVLEIVDKKGVDYFALCDCKEIVKYKK